MNAREDRRPKSKIYPRLVGLLIAILIALSIYLFRQPVGSFSFRPFKELNENIIPSLLIGLAFTTLLLERSLEVLIAFLRGADKDKLDNQVRAYERKINELQKLIDAQIQSSTELTTTETQETEEATGSKSKNEKIIPGSPVIQTGVMKDKLKVIEELNKANIVRTEYESETRKIAFALGLFLSILISLSGVRSLELLLASSSSQWNLPNNLQRKVFHCLDILLTAGLIAGGSQVVHTFIKLFTSFTDAINRINKDKTS